MSNVCLMYLVRVTSSLRRGFPVCQASHVKSMFGEPLSCKDFRVPQASHVKNMFDVSLSCEKFFEAGLSGFPRRPRRRMSTVCLMNLCRAPGSPGVTCQSVISHAFQVTTGVLR